MTALLADSEPAVDENYTARLGSRDRLGLVTVAEL